MALEVETIGGKDERGCPPSNNGKMEQSDKVEEEDDNDEEEEEDDEEDEPRLNYTSLTKYLRPLYRNGDATSAFLVAGDKMVGQSATGSCHSPEHC
jgi:hypothetical protein